MQTVVMLSPPNEVFTVCRNAVAEFGGNSAEMAIEFLACQHCKTNGSAEFGYEASLTRSKIRFMQGKRLANRCGKKLY